MSGQMPYFMGNKNKTLLANKIKVETAAKNKNKNRLCDNSSYQISEGHVFLIHN